MRAQNPGMTCLEQMPQRRQDRQPPPRRHRLAREEKMKPEPHLRHLGGPRRREEETPRPREGPPGTSAGRRGTEWRGCATGSTGWAATTSETGWRGRRIGRGACCRGCEGRRREAASCPRPFRCRALGVGGARAMCCSSIATRGRSREEVRRHTGTTARRRTGRPRGPPPPDPDVRPPAPRSARPCPRPRATPPRREGEHRTPPLEEAGCLPRSALVATLRLRFVQSRRLAANVGSVIIVCRVWCVMCDDAMCRVSLVED